MSRHARRSPFRTTRRVAAGLAGTSLALLIAGMTAGVPSSVSQPPSASIADAITVHHARARSTAPGGDPAYARVPAAAKAVQAAETSRVSHVIVHGETLSSIAQDVYGDPKAWPVIYWANHPKIIKWASELSSGMKLFIPPLPRKIPAPPRLLAPRPKIVLTSKSPSHAHVSAPPAGGGILSAAQVEQLWAAAGGPAWAAPSAAAIASCESGDDPTNYYGRSEGLSYTGTQAAGLFQILGQVVPGNIFNPMVNALNAVAKFRASGDTFAQWVCQP